IELVCSFANGGRTGAIIAAEDGDHPELGFGADACHTESVVSSDAGADDGSAVVAPSEITRHNSADDAPVRQILVGRAPFAFDIDDLDSVPPATGQRPRIPGFDAGRSGSEIVLAHGKIGRARRGWRGGRRHPVDCRFGGRLDIGRLDYRYFAQLLCKIV